MCSNFSEPGDFQPSAPNPAEPSYFLPQSGRHQFQHRRIDEVVRAGISPLEQSVHHSPAIALSSSCLPRSKKSSPTRIISLTRRTFCPIQYSSNGAMPHLTRENVNMRNFETLRHLKSEATAPKSDLLRLLGRLESEGFAADARRLAKIIGSLEAWQCQ